jgi:hypothetical protein
MDMYSCTQVDGDLLRPLGSIGLWPLLKVMIMFLFNRGDHI